MSSSSQKRLRVATYNVNGVNGRLPVLLRWLETTTPDIVCLQELKTSDEKFPAGAIDDAGYGAIWHGQKSYNGVAILARGAKPEEIRRGLPGDIDDTHSRYIEAACSWAYDRMSLFAQRQSCAGSQSSTTNCAGSIALRRYSQRPCSKAGAPSIMCGDYNVVPRQIEDYNARQWNGGCSIFR